MSAEDELLRLAKKLDQDAPPISIDEIEQRVTPTQLTFETPLPPRNTSRRTPIVLAVASVALATAGLALVLAQRSPAPSVRTGAAAVVASVPAPTQPAPSASSPASEPAEPTTTGADPVPSSAPQDPPRLQLDGDVATALAAIDADRINKLRTLTGFTASVVQEQLTLGADGEAVDSQPGIANRVTLLADGSMWAETASGGFASYDPATGQSRGVFTTPDGSTTYQLIEGWTANSTGLTILLGHDPARPLAELAMVASVEVGETSHDGRPAWRIDSTMESQPGPPGRQDGAPQIETYIVDQATGLIVSSSVEWQGTPEQRFRQSSELLDLEIVSAVPDAFPGTFPEGAQIDRSGDPNGFRLVSLSEAAEWFGDGFVGPADVAPGTRIFLTEFEYEPGNPETLGERAVEIEAREGFVTPWRIRISKTQLAPGAPIPDTFMLVDGVLCQDLDNDATCDVIEIDGAPIASGALAGLTPFEEASYLSLERNGMRISISGSEPSQFRPLIESFIAW